jgi:peroxin-19
MYVCMHVCMYRSPSCLVQLFYSPSPPFQPFLPIFPKYPKWIEDNKATLSPEQLTQYTKQLESFKHIIEELNKPNDDPSHIMALLDASQELGQPPADIMTQLIPGMKFDENGNPLFF